MPRSSGTVSRLGKKLPVLIAAKLPLKPGTARRSASISYYSCSMHSFGSTRVFTSWTLNSLFRTGHSGSASSSWPGRLMRQPSTSLARSNRRSLPDCRAERPRARLGVELTWSLETRSWKL